MARKDSGFLILSGSLRIFATARQAEAASCQSCDDSGERHVILPVTIINPKSKAAEKTTEVSSE